MPVRKPTRTNRAARGAQPRDRALHPAMVPLPRLIYGFPEKMYTKMRYVDSYAITSNAGAIAKQVFKINSTFDPDSTGTGHQPLYRDTYASIYNHYAVVKANIKVHFNSNASTSAMICGVLIDDDTSSSSTLTTLLEQNRGKFDLLAQATGSLNNKAITLTWDCKEVLGIDPFSSEEYKTPIAADPTEISCVVVYAAPIDGSSTTSTTFLVELEQWVLWTELTTPTQS